MKIWLATALACLLSIGAWAQQDPKAAVEPLKIVRDTFYQDVSKFQTGQLTEEELVIRITEQFAPLINDRTVALRVMGKFARQATFLKTVSGFPITRPVDNSRAADLRFWPVYAH